MEYLKISEAFAELHVILMISAFRYAHTAPATAALSTRNILGSLFNDVRRQCAVLLLLFDIKYPEEATPWYPAAGPRQVDQFCAMPVYRLYKAILDKGYSNACRGHLLFNNQHAMWNT